MRYLLQMVGIAAPAIVTKVIQFEPRGQRATMQFIADPMRIGAFARPATLAANSPVARLIDHACPAPTPILLALNTAIEPLRKRHRGARTFSGAVNTSTVPKLMRGQIERLAAAKTSARHGGSIVWHHTSPYGATAGAVSSSARPLYYTRGIIPCTRHCDTCFSVMRSAGALIAPPSPLLTAPTDNPGMRAEPVTWRATGRCPGRPAPRRSPGVGMSCTRSRRRRQAPMLQTGEWLHWHVT